jgi:hypothetical protein
VATDDQGATTSATIFIHIGPDQPSADQPSDDQTDPQLTNLLSADTYMGDSGNLSADLPVEHLWDGCTDATEECATGANGTDQIYIDFDLGDLYDLQSAGLFGDATGNWTSISWTFYYKVYLQDPWVAAFSDQPCLGNQWYVQDLTGIAAQYVRFEVNGSAYPAVQINEIQLQGMPSVLPDDSCGSGFHNDGTGGCLPDAPCQPQSCNTHGSCSDTGGSPVCDCNAGYTGATCNECASGYQTDGSGGCVPENPCDAVACGANGVCGTVNGQAQCACYPGYTGSDCGSCAPGFEDDGNGDCISAAGDGTSDLVAGPSSLELCMDQGPVGSSGRRLIVGAGGSYNTIQAAIADANPGDTILIHGGTYNGHININRGGASENKRLVIRNYEDEQVTIVGHSDGTYYAHAVSISAPWVTLHGLNLLADPDREDDRDADVIVMVWRSAPHTVLSCLDFDVPDNQWQTRYAGSPRHRVGGIKIHGADNDADALIEGCTFQRIPYQVISIEGTHVTVRGNTVSNYLDNAVMMEAAGNSGDRAPRRVVIEHNWFGGSLVSDGIQTNSYDYNGNSAGYEVYDFVIRNNILHGFAENAIDLKGTRRVLMEGNIIQGGEGDNDGRVIRDDPADRGGGTGGIAHGSYAAGDHWIIRKNVIYDNNGGVGMSYPTDHAEIYNNTIIANNRDYTGPNSDDAWTNIDNKLNFAGISGCPRQGSVIRNNIIGGHNHAELSIVLECENLDIDHNLYYNSNGPRFHNRNDVAWQSQLLDFEAWQDRLTDFGGITGNDAHSLALNNGPGFVNVPGQPYGDYAGYDFHLTAGSAARDAGGPLTTAVSAGSGRVLRVANPYLFYDGFGIPGEVGDEIVVGGAGSVRINQIDLNAGTLTIDRSISWSAGTPIYLGPFEGSRPDIGAFEYAGTTTPPPAVTQCNDGLDNDGDGAADMADGGCASSSDNDESNCGDGTCEGTERCDQCEDCDPCPDQGAVSPLSRWQLDEGSGTMAGDSTGSNNGTINGGATWISGVHGSAVQFDGVNDYIELTTPIHFDSGATYTISFWINTENINQYVGVLGPESAWGQFIMIAPNEQLSFYDGQSHFTAGTLVPGQWYHAMLVSDGQEMIWYLDGQEVNRSADHNSTTTIAVLGSKYAGSDIRFTGALDDISIFTEALMPSDISGTAPVEPSGPRPIAHWALDEGSGDRADDAEGNGHGTIQGATWISGVEGNALAFDGVDDYVDLASPISFANSDPYTITFWIHVDNLSQYVGVIGPESAWGQFIMVSPNEQLSFYDGNSHFTAGTLTAGQWYHAALVSDGQEMIWYLDGREVNRSTTHYSATTITVLGSKYAGADIRYRGALDDIRIYDLVLSASEVMDLSR